MPQEAISDRYELLEELSHGGMGDVWRGYDAVLDRPVAVKLIRQASVTSPELAEEFAKRFRREARITARIQHPGVPQVYDAVLDASYERLFLVMELVDGVPLSAYLDPGRPLPVSWAAAVAAQVATVLSYAHDVPVIHRDLKPGNILVARDGTVKVLDFGIAAILRTDVTKLTATGSPVGTYQYMSPEQVRGGRVTPRTDLYALGCVLHELLCGRLVFEAESEYLLMYRHVNAAPTPLRQLRPDVPEALEELVLHLLRKAPEARPADTQEVYARLLPFLPPPGRDPGTADAGPAGAPDPTGVFRRPFAPRARAQAPAPGDPAPTAVLPGPCRCPSPAGCARTSRRRTRVPTPCWRRSGSRRPPRCSARSSHPPPSPSAPRAGRSWRCAASGRRSTSSAATTGPPCPSSTHSPTPTPVSPGPPASRPAPAAPRRPGAAPSSARSPTRWPRSRAC